MRTHLAALVGVVAGLLLPLALVAGWAGAVVTDTDRYVETVGPLASDPDVEEAVQRSLSARTVDVVEDAGLSPELARELRVGDLVDAAVAAVVESPGFRPAWEEANADAHADLVAELEGEGSADPVRIDLGGVLDAVISDLSESLPVQLSGPEASVPVTVLDGDQVEQARDPYALLATLGIWLPLLWVAGVVLALVLARSRTRLLGWLGVGSAIGLGLLLLGLGYAQDRIESRVPDSDSQLSGVVWTSVTSDLRLASLVGLGVAVALIGVGVVLAPRRRRPT